MNRVEREKMIREEGQEELKAIYEDVKGVKQ